ncbi:extracellular solute-binding protein [Paenibacillus sp. HWE-109]|uniref:extracellular solute-binding protein n=1 Tax=Paenibacillus sp. HWE-109 TaxID=1306526 RepID=UPI001EDD05A6|nr:extracellular solute-binding protein [Paenibacillus sp. HWE-109]UKS30982.1 extracellular solute-binding protein [Paenibacillus sp. HWE-109]
MKKRVYKASGIILSTVLMSSMLAACGGSTGSEGASTSTPDNATTKASTAPKEKVTLKILAPNNVEEFPAGSDVNNNEIINTLREKTGFNIQWELLPKDSEAARQKLNVLMASGDTPDLIISGDKQVFGNFVQQGLLAPLDTLLNEEGKQVKATLTADQWKSSTSDGKIYAVRTMTASTAVRALMVRQDWMDEAGIKAPKTQTEFYEALKALKVSKPDAVPFVANLSQTLSSLEAIQSMFYPPVDFVQKDGKVVYTPVEPGAKEFLTYTNKLYKEGLIDKEAVVIKAENLKEKLVSSKAAMSTVAWFDALPIEKSLKEKAPTAKLTYLPMPTGDNGSSGYSKVPSLTKYFMVPKASKHPKEIMQFLNKAVNEEIINYISFGNEGKHYEKKDGKFIATKEADNIRFRVYYNMFDTVALGLQRIDQKGFMPYFGPVEKTAKYEDVVDLVPPIPVVDKKSKELKDLRDEYFMKIITGALPLSAYDEFVSKWKQAGGEEVVKALNAAYNGK